ncbi:hypothetical protein F5B21DRAFT_97623 [Xylaria acuta]|nr:hypothetical protein F5B21DRAFT_97623 [Xylaria acuta]
MFIRIQAMASFCMTGHPGSLKLTANNISGLLALRSDQERVIDATGFTVSTVKNFEERRVLWMEVAPKGRKCPEDLDIGTPRHLGL